VGNIIENTSFRTTLTSESGNLLDLRSIFGIQARITTPAEATSGEFVEMDCILDSGGATDPHRHPRQEERYDVIEGTLEVYCDGTWHAVPGGQSFVVPPGAIHAFRNRTSAPVRFLNRHAPALAFQQHLETVDRLVRQGKVRGLKDARSLMHLCMSAVKHQPDVPVKPPQWVIRAMAFLGRRLGYTLG
jgi:mannose-6-phosphate isomerase-like protein (cupin superfamily)